MLMNLLEIKKMAKKKILAKKNVNQTFMLIRVIKTRLIKMMKA
jgi:hypothetical protein